MKQLRGTKAFNLLRIYTPECFIPVGRNLKIGFFKYERSKMQKNAVVGRQRFSGKEKRTSGKEFEEFGTTASRGSRQAA
jgi:hypothetical protein